MEKPEIVIVVEGGLVSAVATTKDKLSFRIIDLDVYKEGADDYIEDLEADQTSIDVTDYCADIIKETMKGV